MSGRVVPGCPAADPASPRGRCRSLAALLGLAVALCASGARSESTHYLPAPCAAQDLRRASEAELLACYAPAFAVAGSERSYNRIGTPFAVRGRLRGVSARVDPARPALYAEQRRDALAGREVLQLVYRVHFEKIPLRLSRYFFEAHRNPGVLVVVTLDAQTRAPWLVTALPTCGCYLALIPTRNLPESWLPNAWPQRELAVFGQRLPARLPDWDATRARLQIALEAASHRVSGIAVIDAAAAAGEASAAADSAPAAERPQWRELPLVALQQLYRLSLPGSSGTVSFFHESGLLRGRVRGAWNPLEGLTLFGLLALDPTVGTDKDFGDPAQTGTRFYTSLPFWWHERSRLDRLHVLLRSLGFELPTPALPLRSASR